MCSFPSHSAGILDHGLERIEQGPIPMLLQNPPAPLDRVVFTVIWRIIHQADREVKALGKIHEAMHELGASAVALRAVIKIDDQGFDEREALFDRFPPVDQAIHQAVARHFRRDPVQKEFIGGGQENAHRCHARRWLKVVVGCLGENAALAPSCKRADLDRRLGVYREPQRVLIGICLLVALLHQGKDGVGLREFFWGWLLATFFG